MKPVRKAILPVAGLGTRFLPATKSIPKEMLPIIDKPLVQYAVEEAVDIGVTEIIFITSHAKKSIKSHFLPNKDLEESLKDKNKEEYIDLINPKQFENIKFTFVNQEEQKGLGHAILLAEDYLDDEDDAVAILLPDDLYISSGKSCLQTLADIYSETSNSVIAINQVPNEKLSSYGVIDPIKISEEIYEINQIVEKPKLEDAPSNLAVSGRYILKTEIFNHLKNIGTGAGGEYQLTDAIKDLISSEKVLAATYKGKKFDCGSKEGYVKATLSLAMLDKDISKDIKQSLESLLS
ncbi:UTP--glucose-1-phosphate uridylyltransferase GalU [Gammaproteobacteria bacterium]|nr:UTP--glucose-1-phosphate uridylyltransferase GalU [Gammaproteobacteria bacterium]